MCPGCFLESYSGTSCSNCGYSGQVSNSVILRHQTLLNERYKVGNVLVRPGRFSITYLCYDKKLESRIAVKEYLPEELVSRGSDGLGVIPKKEADREVFLYGLDTFKNEASSLKEINHPNIVRIHDYFEANSTAYVVMDYYEGIDLKNYLAKEGGKIDEGRARKIMLYVLDGLKDVHSREVFTSDNRTRYDFLYQMLAV